MSAHARDPQGAADRVIVTATEAGIGPFLSIDEVAALLGVTPKTIRNRIYAGDVAILALEPTQPLAGGEYRFPVAAVQAALERGRQRVMGFARPSKGAPPVVRRRSSVPRSA